MNIPLQIGLIGTGLMSGIYGKILRQRPDCRLCAVTGNSRDKTDRFAAAFGIAGYSGGQFDLMFDSHPEMDAVIITTPEWVRVAPVDAAVRHAKHILLEKPFAASLEQALVLQHKLAGYPKIFELCHALRHSPRFYALHRAVAGGDIGAVRHIYARRNSNNVRVGRVLGKTDLAFWLTPHDVDIMRWITGAEVQEVFARSRHALTSADDYLIANLRFANGVDAVLEVSWCNPPLSAVSRQALFEVWGTGGYIELDDSDMNIRVFAGDGRVGVYDTYEDFEVQGLHHGMFENLIDYFVERVRTGVPDGERVRDGVESIRVCDMISRSIRAGAIVARD